MQPVSVPDILATLSVRLLMGGRVCCDPTWAPVERVSCDPFCRIYWPRTGSGWTEHHGRRYLLRPGVLSLIPAHARSRYHCPVSMTLDWIHCTTMVLHSLDLFTYLTMPHEIVIADVAWMDRLWDDFLERQARGGLGTPVALEGFLHQVIALFIDHADLSGTQQLHGAARFHRVLEYIELHLADKITLADLASLMQFHPGYFSMQFTRVMGMGPTAYVNQRRMDYARRLLRETNAALDVIATAVGCCDVYYFSRLFKRSMGMTPWQYRIQAAIQRP